MTLYDESLSTPMILDGLDIPKKTLKIELIG